MWTSLVGFVASGKTALASAVGQAIRQPSVDLDRAVAQRAGLDLPAIFATSGVSGFRELEQAVLQELPPAGSLLVATGGGSVESPSVRSLLRARGVVFWLDAPWETLRQRLEADGPQRWPLLEHLGWDGLERLYRRRLRLYATVADFRLPSGSGDLSQLAHRVLLRRARWRGQVHPGRA